MPAMATSLRMGRPLRVLSWAGAWGEGLAEAVSWPFTEATGVAVEPVRHVGLRLPEALERAFAARAAPPVDVVWCNTSPALRAADRGWCEALEDVRELDELGPRAAEVRRDGWPVAPVYTVPYVLVYRRALYPEPPRSWRVLERPAHAGKVVLYPGGNGFYPVAQLLGGGAVAGIPDAMDPCWAAVAGLRGQLGPRDYSIGLGEVIRRGAIDLCYRALPNVLAFQADGLDVDWAAPDEGIADTTDAMWLPRGLPADVQACARAYIGFALSRRVQDRWCERMAVLPLHRDAGARHAAFARPGMPRAPDDLGAILHVPEQVKAIHEPAWEARFEAIVQAA